MAISCDRVDHALKDRMGMGGLGSGAITDRHEQHQQTEEGESDRPSIWTFPEPEDVWNWKSCSVTQCESRLFHAREDVLVTPDERPAAWTVA